MGKRRWGAHSSFPGNFFFPLHEAIWKCCWPQPGNTRLWDTLEGECSPKHIIQTNPVFPISPQNFQVHRDSVGSFLPAGSCLAQKKDVIYTVETVAGYPLCLCSFLNVIIKNFWIIPWELQCSGLPLPSRGVGVIPEDWLGGIRTYLNQHFCTHSPEEKPKYRPGIFYRQDFKGCVKGVWTDITTVHPKSTPLWHKTHECHRFINKE